MTAQELQTMTATVENVYREHEVILAVTDGPVLKKQYGKRSYRVDRIRVRYRQFDDGPWQVGGVHLIGPYIKADGTDGVDTNTDHLWDSRLPEHSWLPPLIAEHTPEAAS